MPTFLIVDDSDAVRRQLRRIIERNPSWKFCGEAQDGREAIEKALSGLPDVVLLDYRLPVINGLQAAREISKLAPQIRILLCSMHVSPDLSGAAREAGCRGAVSKHNSRQITLGIEAILKDEFFFETEETLSW